MMRNADGFKYATAEPIRQAHTSAFGRASGAYAADDGYPERLGHVRPTVDRSGRGLFFSPTWR